MPAACKTRGATAPEPSSQAPRAARFVLTVDRGDPSTVDHRERLWDRRSEIAADPFQILYQKNCALCDNRHNLNFANPPSPRVRSAVNHHHPHYRPSTMANVSGSAVRDRDPTIRDYFQKMLSSAPRPKRDSKWRLSNALGSSAPPLKDVAPEKWGGLLFSALAFGMRDAAEGLASRGACIGLSEAAGPNRVDDVVRLLPFADQGTRHRAFCRRRTARECGDLYACSLTRARTPIASI